MVAEHSAQPSGRGPAALDAAVLSIADQDGNPWGVGFLVGSQTALTCAHVVSAALGTPEGHEPSPTARVHVDLPLLPGRRSGAGSVPAEIQHFVPGGSGGGGDVAVLRLEAALPGGRPAVLVDASDVWGHPARAFGFPAGRPAGVWHAGVLRSRQADGWIQADLAADGYRVSGGFSGSPVWDEELGAVVGMVTAAESGEPPASYLIPVDSLLRSWEPLRELALPPSPFRGLAAFREADAASFHGRDEESGELAAQVTADRWVCLVGPSGSGKSSLALAGAVPQLRAQDWSVALLRPASGSRPLSALAAALLPLLEPDSTEVDRLTRLPALTDVLARQGVADTAARVLEAQGTRRLLVVVDQFEELLAATPSLIDELAQALYTESLPTTVHVLTTLRADFLERALSHAQLGRAFRQRLYALGALGPEGLREIVTAPVAAVPGVDYESGLVERILADTGDEPGALPLLAFTLDRLWQHQRRGLLTHRAYEELGGVTGALGHHAERLWTAHVPNEAASAARRLFTALVRVPAGSDAATRRTVFRDELDDDAWHTAQNLASVRLLVTGRSPEGRDTVELAHEALISGWRRLADWTSEDRDFLTWRETLRQDKQRWEQGGCPADLLPTPAALEAAQPWLRDRPSYLTDDEHTYLRLGREHQQARARKRRILTSTLACLTALALILSSLFAYYRHVSHQRAAESASRALAQSSADLDKTDPVVSVMTALAAYRTAPTEQARDALLHAKLSYHPQQRMLSGSDGSVGGFSTSQDGNVILLHSRDGKPTLYVHAASGTVRRQRLDLPHQSVRDVVSGDGRRAGFITEDRELVWFDVDPDGSAGHLVGEAHRMRGQLTSSRISRRDNAAMSEDGRFVAMTGEDARRLTSWDLKKGTTGPEIRIPSEAGKLGRFAGLEFGSNGRTVLAEIQEDAGERASLVAFDRLTRRSHTIIPETSHIEMSDNGKFAAVSYGKNDSRLTLRRTDNGKVVHRYTGKGLITSLDLPAEYRIDDSGRWAAAMDEEKLRLLDLKRNRVASEVTDPEAVGSMLVGVMTVDGTPTALTSPLGNKITFSPLPPGGKAPEPLAMPRLSPDGDTVTGYTSGGKGIETRTTDESGRVLHRAKRQASPLTSKEELLQYGANGKFLADKVGKNTVEIRRASDLKPLRKITSAKPPPYDADSESIPYGFFFQRGELVTSSGSVVQQWNPETGTQNARVDVRKAIPGVRSGMQYQVLGHYTPHHISVVVWGDPKVHIIDLATGRRTGILTTGSDTASIKFDPSGEYFSVLHRGLTVELWQRSPRQKKIGPLLLGNGDQEFVAGFTGSGTFLQAATTTARLYDVGEGRATDTYTFGVPEGDVEDQYSYRDASANGKVLLLSNTLGDYLRPVHLAPAQWQKQLCRVIGNREFTEEEKGNLGVPLPDEPLCREG
ncbi:nSTAND1 domain-containing NTPase [Streptomyces coffeae]|uniref:Trypsin-like peptidase domain-containing protein n=1 Tax=Streptomyces coffeae TaxID=621382 RepID=A0ABS1NPG6_9ACTN|nr:trypsin-like peptidase domain-containing protein [Streptomyces coffeae]MBL1101990.1 trypsin-like peptidase domain-containing protein [Streptomyces coffeae]